MDYKSLKRDKATVLSTLVQQSDSSVITKTGCKIVFPERFLERGLASIGADPHCIGMFAVIVNDEVYSVANVLAFVHMEPSSVSSVKLEDDTYIELTFDKGAKVFKTNMLVAVDTLVYDLFSEVISKGNYPWYVNYIDIGNFLDTAKEYANANLGARPEVMQLVTSIVARDPSDRSKQYRGHVKSMKQVMDEPPAWVPLRSVIYTASNTTNKLLGSYFNEGVVSALVNPSERVEKIEELLRK